MSESLKKAMAGRGQSCGMCALGGVQAKKNPLSAVEKITRACEKLPAASERQKQMEASAAKERKKQAQTSSITSARAGGNILRKVPQQYPSSPRQD